MSTQSMLPTIVKLNALETSVLLEKYMLILSLLTYGTPEERVVAKKELQTLEYSLGDVLNTGAYTAAQNNLGLFEEEIHAIELQ